MGRTLDIKFEAVEVDRFVVINLSQCGHDSVDRHCKFTVELEVIGVILPPDRRVYLPHVMSEWTSGRLVMMRSRMLSSPSLGACSVG